LLAADFGGLIAIAFLLISFIGWISNLVGEKQKAEQIRNRQPQRPRAPQDKRIRDEIDAFLQEATGQQRRPPADARRDDMVRPEDVEVVREPRPSPPPVARPQPRPEPARKPVAHKAAGGKSQPAKAPPPLRPSTAAGSSPPTGRQGPGQQVGSRHVATQPLGAELQQHVRQRMSDRITTLTPTPGGARSVAQSVSAHLGSFTAERATTGLGIAETTSRRSTPASAYRAMLRQPQGMRQAIILAEVLKRPKFRRS